MYVGRIQDWLRDEEVREVDLVIGGPPCQGFSSLGARRIDDERNMLWRHYAITVARATPNYFVLENVPQFASSPQFSMFRDMTKKGGVLADYEPVPHLVNAADHGAAQVRRRVVVVGRRRDLPDPGFPTPSHARPGLPGLLQELVTPQLDTFATLSTTLRDSYGTVGSPVPQGLKRRT